MATTQHPIPPPPSLSPVIVRTSTDNALTPTTLAFSSADTNTLTKPQLASFMQKDSVITLQEEISDDGDLSESKQKHESNNQINSNDNINENENENDNPVHAIITRVNDLPLRRKHLAPISDALICILQYVTLIVPILILYTITVIVLRVNPFQDETDSNTTTRPSPIASNTRADNFQFQSSYATILSLTFMLWVLFFHFLSQVSYRTSQQALTTPVHRDELDDDEGEPDLADWQRQMRNERSIGVILMPEGIETVIDDEDEGGEGDTEKIEYGVNGFWVASMVLSPMDVVEQEDGESVVQFNDVEGGSGSGSGNTEENEDGEERAVAREGEEVVISVSEH